MMNSESYNEKWLITGISSGIGYELAKQILESGNQVVGVVRNIKKCENLKTEYGEQLSLYELDLEKTEKIEEVMDKIFTKHPDIKVVVNNAGISMKKKLEDISYDDVNRMMNINLISSLLIIKFVVQSLKSESKKIIQISSMSGIVPSKFWSLYAASKHGINGFCESISEELSEKGIQMMIVEPGNVNTPLWEKHFSEDCTQKQSISIDIDARKLAKIVIDTASLEELPLHLALGSKANNSIIKLYEKRITHYKNQMLLSSLVDSNKLMSKKIILPPEIGMKKIILWPAGKNIIRILRNSDLKDISDKWVYFADSDRKKVGKYFFGKRIVHIDDVIDCNDYFFVITSDMFCSELCEILDRHGKKKDVDYCTIEDLLRSDDE